MNPLIAGQPNALGYLAEKRDGSGAVISGTNVTLRIRNVTDGQWWNAITGQWQEAEVTIAATHVSGGWWEYLWTPPAEDVGDLIQELWEDESDNAVQDGRYGRVYSPESLVGKLLTDLLSDGQAFPGAHLDARLSQLALEATLQAVKGKTDNLPAHPAMAGEAAAALLAWDPPTYQELQAALAALPLLSPEQAKAAGAEALAEFGPARPGDQMALSGEALSAIRNGLILVDQLLEWLQAVVRKDVVAPPDFGGDYDPARDSLQALQERVTSTRGSGSLDVAVLIADELGRAVTGIIYTVLSLEGVEQGYARPDPTTGRAHFRLEAGSYKLRPGSSALYQWGAEGEGEYEIEVAGTTEVHLTCTTRTLPAPADPTLCRCWDDFRWVEGGELVEAGQGRITVTRLIAPAFPQATAGVSYACRGTQARSGADGRAYLDLVQGTTVELLLECGDSSRPVTVAVPHQETAYIPDHLTQ